MYARFMKNLTKIILLGILCCLQIACSSEDEGPKPLNSVWYLADGYESRILIADFTKVDFSVNGFYEVELGLDSGITAQCTAEVFSKVNLVISDCDEYRVHYFIFTFSELAMNLDGSTEYYESLIGDWVKYY